MSIALVTSTKFTVTTSPGTSGAINTTGASLLIAFVGGGTDADPSVLSDSKGNTWSQLTKKPSGASGQSRMYWSAPSSVGSGHTFTYTNGTNFIVAEVVIAAFSGTDPSPFDKQDAEAAVGTGTIKPVHNPPFTPAQDNELIVVGLMLDATQNLTSIDSGFTLIDGLVGAGGTNQGCWGFYKVQTTAATVDPSIAHSNFGAGASAIIAAFKALAVPTIVETGAVGAFAPVPVGTASSNITFTVSGINLTANIVVTAPSTDFQVSLSSGSGFGSSVSIAPTSGTVSTTTIYCRFTPQSRSWKSGNITCTSTGATTQNVAVNGIGTITYENSLNLPIDVNFDGTARIKKIVQGMAQFGGGNVTVPLDIFTADIFDVYLDTHGADVTNPPTLPDDGDVIEARFTDNGTGRGITWGTMFVASASNSLPTTTTANKQLCCWFEWIDRRQVYFLIRKEQQV